MAERLVDTMEDVRLHLARLVTPENGTEDGVEKPVVVVLGSGWGAHSLIKVVDDNELRVILISPRNFFFFTPLLANSSVGTTEVRSLVDPIRRANPRISYYEAAAEVVDLDARTVQCVGGRAGDQKEFVIAYDHLVVSVGEKVGTFGVPGVLEHAHFLKEIGDARRIRANIIRTFEAAALPFTTEEEQKQLLRFVVVGGGPTGCEFFHR